MSNNWQNIPSEMQSYPQWAIAAPDKSPYTLDASGKLVRVSVHEIDKLLDFQTACKAAAYYNAGIGFILSTRDPFTCIDLDVKNQVNESDMGKWTTPEDIDRFQKIVNYFDTYTELSRSGIGLHLWAKGFIGAGARRDHVEVYSQERFIICTGNKHIDKPIEERQEGLEILVEEIRKASKTKRTSLVELEEEYSDAEIFERALEAANGDKFKRLCAGDWKNEFPSQSEADLALMSMFAFYSVSNEQCRRLFRLTELGKREKAVKNNRYLDFTLEIIRGRIQREQESMLAAQKAAATLAENLAQSLVDEIQHVDYADVAMGTIAAKNAESAPLPQFGGDDPNSLPWPPGLCGAIAKFIYQSSPRPVKEVSIVAALGFLAGVCGKAFTIPKSGLNLYIILVARSGIGKESMHTGMAMLQNILREANPAAQRFVDFSDMASGPALVKACSENSCFVHVAGEFGRKLQRLAQEVRPDGPMQQLRTVMTNLYQKSGPTSVVGGISYSDKEKKVVSVSGVAYSMIGETTPGTFYESLTQSMMEDGFLSRFLIIDYPGDRPDLNMNQVDQMDPALAHAIQSLATQAINLNSQFKNCMVQPSAEAFKMLNDFNYECDERIRATKDESVRQMWNRAHLKVVRVAALLAAADNYITPIISAEHVTWALSTVRRDISIMSSRLESGDIGVDDAARERKMLAVLREYLQQGAKSKAYGCPETLYRDYLVPQRYISMRLSRTAQFLNARQGSSKAIKDTIRSLTDNGYMVEVRSDQVVQKHNYHGVCYKIVSLPPIQT